MRVSCAQAAMLRLWSHPRLKELGFQLVLQARAAGAAGAAGTGAQSASVFGPRVLGRTLRRPSGSKGLLDGFSYGVVLSEFNPLKVRLTLSGSEMGQPNRALPVLGGAHLCAEADVPKHFLRTWHVKTGRTCR